MAPHGRGTRIREDYHKLFFTIIDFKGATRLFADPDFDGEPVIVHEPKPDEPITPPDGEETTGKGGEGETDDPPGGTRTGPGPGGTGEPRTRYVVDDVGAKIAVERSQYLDADGMLITEDYRVLLRADMRRILQSEFRNLNDFLKRWSDADRKQAVLDELQSHGIPLDILAQAVPQGDQLDAFDLVAHVAFDQKPLTRRERAQAVKKRDLFARYGDQARAVLDALLDKFADHGVRDLEDPQILELPPFSQYGSRMQIWRQCFGGPDQYRQAIQALEAALYDPTLTKQSA